MSIPFRKTKKEAVELWGYSDGLVKVYVPRSRGFIQARTSGFYWIPKVIASDLGLRKKKLRKVM